MQRFWIGSIIVMFSLVGSVASADSEGVIQVPSRVPYSSEAAVPTNVVNECTNLGVNLAKSLDQYSTKYGVPMQLMDEIGPDMPGKVFLLEITQVFSAGNAFIGHRKSMAASGELFEDGVSKGKVDFTRNSGGGFGGGFMGSCAVLSRCTKTLGSDFAKWLGEQRQK